MVSICSLTAAYQDLTTIFNGGEHPFVRHRSYVRYSDAGVYFEAEIQRKIDDGYFELHDNCSDELLTAVVGGFEFSRFAKPYTKNFIEDADA